MSSRLALAFSFLDRYAGLLLSILSSMVVARLLTPAEIGVFSVAMVLLSFISAMRDFGAGQYLVQEKELTTDRIRATWTVQLGLGLGFALIVLAAAVPVSHFYAEPRMRDIMFLLSLNFAVSPFGSLTYAWLMREMRFDSLAMMRFAGSLTGACVSVGMAWKGFGAVSLAAGSLAATVANATLAVYLRPAAFPWMPGWTDVKRVLAFGGKVSLTAVINTIGYSVAELVLGKAQGMVSVGLYSRANGLASMFQRLMLDATQAVALPLFAKATREGTSLGPIFLRATAYVTALGWSFFAVMIVLAPSIVRVLYGGQWDGSVPLTRQIAMAMAITLPTAFCANALMAGGHMNSLVRITVLTVLQTSVFVAIGASAGLAYLGWAIIGAACVSAGIWLAMSPVVREVPLRAFVTMLLQGACIALLAAGAASVGLLVDADGFVQHVLRLAIGVPAAAAAFLIGLFASGHPLAEEFIKLYREVRARWAGATE